jgi:hypothetical protein
VDSTRKDLMKNQGFCGFFLARSKVDLWRSRCHWSSVL